MQNNMKLGNYVVLLIALVTVSSRGVSAQCAPIPDCVTCSASSVCDSCRSGYGVNERGGCTPCSTKTGCSQCITLTQCKVCASTTLGPKTDGSGECAPCAPNCRSCKTNGAQLCDVCLVGYALDGAYKCIACTPYCTRCNIRGGGLCNDNSCNYGYGLDTTSFTCSPCADGCKICTVSGPGKCDSCLAGQGLNNGQGTAPTDCIACADTNCAYCYYNNAICNGCKAGFFLDAESGSCTVCSDTNCAQCYSATTKCDVCRPRFRLNPDSGICEACALHCSNCNVRGAGLCDATFCDNGYAIDSNYKCIASCPAGCTSCANNGPGMCDTCLAEQGLNNGVGAAPADCIACEDTNCAFCEDNHMVCTYCKPGYTPDATSGLCTG